MASWQQLVPGGGATTGAPVLRQPVRAERDLPARRADTSGAPTTAASTGTIDTSLEQQLTCGGRIPANRGEDADGIGDHLDVILTDMQFDPFDPQRRFAVGIGGAFMTRDGVNWERLLDTGAMRGRPSNCYFDCDLRTVESGALRRRSPGAAS